MQITCERSKICPQKFKRISSILTSLLVLCSEYAYDPFTKTNHNNACTLWVHGSKKICWEPREGCDSHMKMMEYSPPRLELIMDYAWNQYNRRGITADCQ